MKTSDALKCSQSRIKHSKKYFQKDWTWLLTYFQEQQVLQLAPHKEIHHTEPENL